MEQTGDNGVQIELHGGQGRSHRQEMIGHRARRYGCIARRAVR